MTWYEALAVSTGIVAVSEIGDKTQLLAFLLAARFQRPAPVILGIFVATVLNHCFAALLGLAVGNWLTPEVLRWVLVAGFGVMAGWVLIPDKIDDEDEEKPKDGRSAFLTTVVAFFLLEMGDKTQIATIALAAKYQNLWAVTTGTTLGMMIADVPAVFVGDKLSKKVPLALVRWVSAGLFLVLGVLAALGVGFG